MHSHKGAFTLIELLIVVAIIAILAAIAVPNFMEAQTRAKVSLAKANLRTMATAIECYRIDTGSYPPHPYVHWEVTPFAYMLTTPISYVSGSIDDPFASHAQGIKDKGRFGPHPCLFYMGGLREMASSQGVSLELARFTEIGNMLYHQPLFPREFWERYRYGLASVGPDLMPGYFGTPQEFAERPGSALTTPHAVIYYDPTNGTKSLGNIYYYGPGGGIDPVPQPGREMCWQEELHQ